MAIGIDIRAISSFPQKSGITGRNFPIIQTNLTIIVNSILFILNIFLRLPIYKTLNIFLDHFAFFHR